MISFFICSFLFSGPYIPVTMASANKTCQKCQKKFSQPESLNRHLRSGTCDVKTNDHLPDYVPLIKGDVNPSISLLPIIEGITSKRQRFIACQTMGVFMKGFYPLIFNFKRSTPVKNLEHFASESESLDVLSQILSESPRDPIFLRKQLKFRWDVSNNYMMFRTF